MSRLLTTTFLKLTLLHYVHGMRVEPSLTDTFNHYEEYYTPSSSSSLLHSLDVYRSLIDSGFHRILHTEIIFDGNGWSSINQAGVDSDEEFLSVIIVENITSDLYVDIDQTSSLYSMTGEPQVIVSAHMDTEKPSPVSSSHVALVYSKLKQNKLIVDLPIHFRYQAPCSESHYVPIIIPPPLVLFKIQGENLTDNVPAQYTKLLPCDCESSELCEWRMIEYKLSNRKEVNGDSLLCVDTHKEVCDHVSACAELVADIPCGLEPNALFVVALTVVVTLLATVYLCVNIVFASSISLKHQSKSRAS